MENIDPNIMYVAQRGGRIIIIERAGARRKMPSRAFITP